MENSRIIVQFSEQTNPPKMLLFVVALWGIALLGWGVFFHVNCFLFFKQLFLHKTSGIAIVVGIDLYKILSLGKRSNVYAVRKIRWCLDV